MRLVDFTARSLGLALIAAFPGALEAQQPDSARADTAQAVELAPIEVVGTILAPVGPRIGSGVPARTAILRREEIEAMEPRLLTDLLVSLPGFSSYDDLGASYKLSLSSRGFYASPVVGVPQGISVFLDGVRQNEPDAAQVNFDLLPMEHVTRVEVMSGTASLLGRNSLGGSINLVTNSGGGPAHGALEVSGGSYKTFGTDGSVSGSIGGDDWSYYAGGGYDREDGWRQETGAKAYNGFFNLGRLGPLWGVRLQGYGAYSYARPAGSLPESVYRTNPDSNLTTGDYEDLDNLQLSVSGYRTTGPGQISATLFYRKHRAERFNVNQAADPDNLGRSDNGTFGGTADYRWQAGDRLGLRVGVEGSSAQTEVQLYADSTKFAGPVLRTTFVRSPTWDLAGYALADYAIGRATVSFGARYDYVRIPFENRLDPTRDTTSAYSRLSPKGGVSVELGRGWTVFGSVGTAYRAPAVIELACADEAEPCPLPFALGDDPPVKPVRAVTYEAGGRLVAGQAILTASAYRTDVRDEVVLLASDLSPSGSTIEGYFDNLDKTRRVGLELSGQLFLGGGHTLYANYAFTRATYQSDAEIFSVREDFGGENDVKPGDRFPLVPDHQAKLGGSFDLTSGFSLGIDGRYIGSQYLRGDEANEEEKLDDYFVMDARVGWEGAGWELNLVATNVLQSEYASFGTFNVNQGAGGTLERFLTPGYKRVVRLIVRRSFGAD